jgi:hypothetical protein
MGTIKKILNKNGSFSFRAIALHKDEQIHHTFTTEEDALLFIAYKERLLKNKEAFDVDISKTISFEDLMNLKKATFPSTDRRTLGDIETSLTRLKEMFKDKIIYSNITYEDWKNAAVELSKISVYRGAKNGKNKRLISIHTLRKIFAHASSAVTHAQSLGMELINHPLAVIKTTINCLKKKL